MKKLARQTGEATLTKSGILECIKKLLTAKNILGPLLKFFFVLKKSLFISTIPRRNNLNT